MVNPIDEYIKNFPKEVQEKLETLRDLIRKEVSEAEETISYGIPTFKLNGKYVVYFAGFKSHISLYPILETIQAEVSEVAEYMSGRGTLKFPLNKPLPLAMIRKVVKLLVEENNKRTKKY
jgi:uncharacterized protein YdhG (YjbR/CyaY superfamily)